MRSTVACSWCRKSKIKCHHSGTPPCRACSLNPSRECILTPPPRHVRKHQHRLSQAQVSLPPPVGSNGDSEHMTEEPRVGEADNTDNTVLTRNRIIPDPLRSTHPSLIKRGCLTFMQLFPEFGFFHRPKFFEQLRNNDIDSLKLCAIMALCARYIPELVSNHGGQMKASEFYAKYVRAHIMERVTSYADIDTVQTLVLLSLHDWGSCNGFRAWMYIGMATRMSQTIEAGLKDMESRTSEEPRTPHSTPIIRESIRRTIWACFVMDCMLGCGKHRPQSFRSSELDFPLPISNEDFEFESQAAAIAPSYLVRFDHGDRDNTPMPPRNLTMGSEQSLAIIIQGVDIWSSLSSWICSGGRKIKSSGPSYPPWNENSCWYQVNKALQFWRVRLSPRLIYSPKNNNLVVHVSRNHGEVFVIINLLYYINLVFLHREYIPFFPHRVYHPCGPIDAPLLSEEAPPGWWNESAKTLFEAAANIVDLLQGLHQNDILFQTPFTSFCLYVAAGTLAYGHTWPHMAPGLLHAQEKYNWGFQWLQQASSLWPISKGWHETLAKLSILYERIQKDAVRYSGVGRDRFADLEDSLNRMAEVEGGGATGGGGSAPAANILLTLAQSSSPIIENENGPVVGSEQTRQNQQHDHQLNPPNHLSMPPSHHYDHSQPNNNNNNNQEEQNDNEPSLPHHSIPHSSPPPPPFSPSIKDFMGSQDLLTSMMGEPLGDWFPNFSIF